MDAALARLDFFEALRADLACAVPEPSAFAGDALSLRLVRLVAPPGGGPEDIRAAAVRWEPASGAVRRTCERTGAPEEIAVHAFAPRFSYARLVAPASSNAPAELVWTDVWRAPGPPAAVRAAFGAESWELPVPCFDPADREKGAAP